MSEPMSEQQHTPLNAWGSSDTDVTDAELVGGPEGFDVELGIDVPLGPELHVDGSGLEPVVLERAAALGLAREALRVQRGAFAGMGGEPRASVGELILLAEWLLTGHDDPRNVDLGVDLEAPLKYVAAGTEDVVDLREHDGGEGA